MLVLERYVGQRVHIGPNVWVSVVRVRSEGRVRLGFEAPDDVAIVREELIKREEKPRAA